MIKDSGKWGKCIVLKEDDILVKKDDVDDV